MCWAELSWLLSSHQWSLLNVPCAVRSVLRSLEGDPRAVGVKAVHVLLCAMGSSEDRLQAAELLSSQSWEMKEVGSNLLSLGVCFSAYGNHCWQGCEVLGRDRMRQVQGQGHRPCLALVP